MRKQIALCIGQNNYNCTSFPKLRCAVNDAKSMAEKLKNLHFDVTVLENLSRNAFNKAIKEFASKLPQYENALFFYAGHGCESGGDNLLIPTDITDDADLIRYNSINLSDIIKELEGKSYKNALKIKIIILDACRFNPNLRGVCNNGFAPIYAPKGTIIAFSTSPGQCATEKEDHGCYTKALLENIDIPRISIEDMFKRVREKLAAISGGKQISWEHTSLMGEYSFNIDTIENFVTYSDDALHDSTYDIKNSPIAEIIGGLKTLVWDSQKSAIYQLQFTNFDSVPANDLFVLGRNIYQAATGNCFSAQAFIDNFNSSAIPEKAKLHILNGMAYEIYYDSNNNLRCNFKTDYYLPIISLLEKEKYQFSKNFIVSKLLSEDKLFIYIPSSGKRLNFDIECELLRDYGSISAYPVTKIYFSGKNIFTNENDDSFNANDCTIPIRGLKKLIEKLAVGLVAPPDMIKINFINNKEINKDSNFLIPFNCKFKN